MSVYQVKVYHQTQPFTDPRIPHPTPRPADEPVVTPKLETTIEAHSEEGACLKVRRAYPEFDYPGSYAVLAVKVY